jgi:hypothetical protein
MRAAQLRASALGTGGPRTCPASDAPTAEARAGAPRDRLASRRRTPFLSARFGSGCAPPTIVRTADTRVRLQGPRELNSEREPAAGWAGQRRVRLARSFESYGFVEGRARCRVFCNLWSGGNECASPLLPTRGRELSDRQVRQSARPYAECRGVELDPSRGRAPPPERVLRNDRANSRGGG